MLGCVVLAADCGGEREPLLPTAPTAPHAPPAPTAVEASIHGRVTDVVWRPLADAVIEVLDGPMAGSRTIADGDGRFAFTGMAPRFSTVTLRGSKDGYQPATTTATWRTEDRSVVVLRLASFEPAIPLDAGAYTLTLAIDLSTAVPWPPAATCVGFPAELASRTYDATITEGPLAARFVGVKGQMVWPFSGFDLAVDGDHVAFEIEYGIVEELRGFRYLNLWGIAPLAQATVDSSSISIPFHGWFRYCRLTSAARGGYTECSQEPAEQRLEYHSCSSDKAIMTFNRR